MGPAAIGTVEVSVLASQGGEGLEIVAEKLNGISIEGPGYINAFGEF